MGTNQSQHALRNEPINIARGQTMSEASAIELRAIHKRFGDTHVV